MTGKIVIRRARAGDEAALALVGRATFLETFAPMLSAEAIVNHCREAHSSAQYRRWLEASDCAVWLAEAKPGLAPVGYAVAAPPKLPLDDAEGDVELKRIYLLGRYQGNGTGKRLLECAVDYAASARAARLLLGVYIRNEPAIAFYHRQGFKNLTHRKFHIGAKVYDDHVMGLTL